MEKKLALAGNRTRASRVAGENSTTEPPVLVRLSTLASYNRTLAVLKRLKLLLLRSILYTVGKVLSEGTAIIAVKLF